MVILLIYSSPITRTAVLKTLANGGLQGKNDFGKFGYSGSCPPSGIHRYFFKLYAIDKKLGLAAGANKSQILATAELIRLYKRQP